MVDKVKVFTGSGSFNIQDEMLKDSTDLLDNVEITTIAAECIKLKQKEDEIAALEDQLKSKKAEADDIGSRVIPELLAEQGLTELKLQDGSKVSVKKEFRATLPKDDLRREAINQRDKALNLQAELDEMKFLLNDASEDLISISKAQNLIREDRKLNDIHYKGKIPRL